MSRERQHYNVTLAILLLAGSAYSLSSTIVVPALPTLQRDLHTTSTWATWVLTGFLVVAAVATPVMGKLGDQHGKERILVVALLFFLAGSIGAAAAWSIWSLIAFRALQGVAGAIFPLAIGIIRDEFPPEKVAVGIGTISAVFGVGGGAGILLAGVIVDNVSWRWIFVGSAVLIAVGTLLVLRYIPESPIKTPSRIDVPGLVTFSAGMVALLLGLTEGDGWGWTSARTLGLFAAAAASFAGWVLVELCVSEPLVDMRMFRLRPVLVTNTAAVIAGFAMFGAFVLLPVFLQTPVGGDAGYGFGASVTETGLYMIPGSFAILVAGPLAGWIGRRASMKWPLASGLLTIGATCAAFALWHESGWEILVQQAVMGIGVGFAFASMATLITEAVPFSQTGVANGMNTVMRTVGSVIGAQLGAAILAASTLRPGGPPTIDAFRTMFWIAAGVAIVGAALALFVTPLGSRRRPSFAAAASGRD